MSRGSKTAILVEGAVMAALATVLSFVRIYKLPWGGSITLLSMLPIIIFSIRHGVKAGFGAAFVFSLIQFGQGVLDGLFAWGLTPGMLISCIFFDYIFAFTALGIGGIFGKHGYTGKLVGAALAVLLRFGCHFLSGVFVWKTVGDLWSGFSTDNVYVYSLCYNGSFMLPELVFTLLAAAVVFKVTALDQNHKATKSEA